MFIGANPKKLTPQAHTKFTLLQVMKIAFDLSNLRSRNQTGVGVYTINLIKSLQKKGVKCIGSYNFKHKKESLNHDLIILGYIIDYLKIKSSESP